MRVNETACRASYEQPLMGQKEKGGPKAALRRFVSVCCDLEQEVVSRQLALEPFQGDRALRGHDNRTLIRVGD